MAQDKKAEEREYLQYFLLMNFRKKLIEKMKK